MAFWCMLKANNPGRLGNPQNKKTKKTKNKIMRLVTLLVLLGVQSRRHAELIERLSFKQLAISTNKSLIYQSAAQAPTSLPSRV